jgi:uncharacterized protein YcfJ
LLSEKKMFAKLIHTAAAVFTVSAASLLIAIPAQANNFVRTEYTTISQPRQVCWNEQVAVSGNNNSAALIGGIAGGIIGNQVGGGNGRVVATAIGAATGSIVGDRLSYGNRVNFQTVQRCKIVYDQVRVPIQVSVPVAPNVVYVREQPYYQYNRPHRHHRHCNHGYNGY